MRGLIFGLALTLAGMCDGVMASEGSSPSDEKPTPIANQIPTSSVFFEGFQGDEHAFIVSGHKDYSGTKVAAVEHTAANGPEGDKQLTLLEGIAEAGHPLKYGLVGLFDSPETMDDDEPLVLQYEHRPQNGVTCDGGYAKLLLSDPDAGEGIADITASGVAAQGSKVDLSKPEYYAVMFGPDRCGFTNKVHLIIRHKSPVSGEWKEHHLRSPPGTADGTSTALYTLVIRPSDNTFDVSVNGESKRSGSLFEEFDPPFNPPAEIDDPEDRKPDDWVDEAEIPDPEAAKPDDWDEDAPPTVPNMDVDQPEGWLEDEPAKIPDPDAVKPEDWDDEEDGEWEAPLVDNPKCDEAPGCGKWVRPTKRNPEYKGKWSPPMIANPEYKGEWKPRRIPNPDYFVDEHPGRLPPLKGVMFEVMINTGGVAFDNVLVTRDEGLARTFALDTWALEHDAQEQAVRNKAREEARKQRAKLLEDGGLWNTVLFYAGEAAEVVEDNLIVTAVVSTVVLVGSMFFCCGFDDDAATGDIPEEEEGFDEPQATAKSGGRSDPAHADAAGAEEEDDAEEEEEEEEEEMSGDDDVDEGAGVGGTEHLRKRHVTTDE